MRKGALLACGFSFFFALFLIIEYGGLLSHSADHAPPLFLQALYWLQLFLGVGMLIFSIVTYVAIKTQHSLLMSMKCSMPLLFSKLLRFGFWLSLFAFFFIWFRSNEACGVIRRQNAEALLAEQCRCIKEIEDDADTDGPTASGFMGRDNGFAGVAQVCQPKQYHICESDMVQIITEYPKFVTPAAIAQINTCRWCGLDLDGDFNADGVYDHKPCTPAECVASHCSYETKTCPSEAAEFRETIEAQQELSRVLSLNSNASFAAMILISGQGVDECRYDASGRLVSLNISHMGPHSQVDELLASGVLRMTYSTDLGLDWALERGGWELGNVSEQVAKDMNSTGVVAGDCYMGHKVHEREVEVLTNECWIIITAGNATLALFTALITYHYSRVFHSVHLTECAPSEGGHVRMGDDEGSLGGGGGGGGGGDEFRNGGGGGGGGGGIVDARP